MPDNAAGRAVNKAKDKKDEVAGSAKQKVGESTDNKELAREGASQKGISNLKQAGKKIKNVFS